MKYLVNEFLRFLVRLALRVFYKEIVVEGKHNIPKGKSILMVSNHQNALIDPLLLATLSGLKPHFLTRASVFQKPFVAKMLNYIQMIPIYRVRDGVRNMEKNQETFDKSVQVLLKKGSMLIFGEGSHSTKRNLRPMKKGFARIAVQALQVNPELDLFILPVAINYSNHNHSGSKVRITFGEVINPKLYSQNSETLISVTYKALLPLVVEIPENQYENNLQLLINKNVDLTSPSAVKEFLDEKPINVKSVKTPYLRNKLMKLFHLPIYWIWLWMAPKVKDEAFIATFKFVIGLVGLPIWYFTFYFVMSELEEKAWAISFLFLAIIFLFSNKNGQK
ncbi:1-acyl-sn-glycerol-3-phosphate acyltransferase [Belliella baltica DSM 15883]|uniref:1-acyl-sn-glycerol-3-phosphate acyltransferase n=1 Tax=Belliella baltica (strain DSM 15883 / CIP 108006 / LMG 21964 / BA134) TaxID=866536 RepID=I3Z862_BELBD|nr:lysophospholipid acyltransferase family protein [Belliella baltica]AFL85430.1 1-acyl-sn-glycerol-3-phosphate acyltransferase [Belliella baltica DSM 15883]